MRKHIAITTAVLLMAVTGCAAAMTPPVSSQYVCTPEGFALAAVSDGLHLTGSLETPTPGYSARYVPELKAISLIPPQGMVVQVISSVTIDMVLPADVADANGRVDIALEKSFAWGIPAITCTVADSPVSESTTTP